MDLIQEIKNDIMLLKNLGNIPKEVELVLLRKLTSLEKQLTIGGVVKSLPYAYSEQINKIDQLNQTQQGLDLQLSVLKAFANKLGLYDASDYISTYCK